MKRSNILTAAAFSFGAMTAFGQIAQAAPRDRTNNRDNDDRQQEYSQRDNRDRNNRDRNNRDRDNQGRDNDDVRDARREVRDDRQDLREERRDVRRADNPQERREERRDVRDAREELRDDRQDLRRERRQDEQGRWSYVDRYYRNNRPFTGYYNGYNYNNGYRPNITFSYSYNNYNDRDRNNDYRNNDYRYDNRYNNDRYNRRQNRSFEGIVIGRSNGWFTIRISYNQTIRVRQRRNEFRNVDRGDRIRLNGFVENNDIFADSVVILRHR